MVDLFRDKGSCDPPIGSWNVSNVTNFVSQSIASMRFTFYLFIHKSAKRSLTQFICSSNNIIATILVIFNVNHIARLPLLSQSGMFLGATAFNQNIGGWNVSSGTHFVSGIGLLKCLSCSHLFGLLLHLGSLYLLLQLSLKGCMLFCSRILYHIHAHC